MKEIIFLDDNYLNSVIAQLDEGVISSYSKIDGTQGAITNTKETGDSKGLEGIVQIGARYVKEVKETSGTELTNSQEKVIDYVLNDYSLDILLKKTKDFQNFSSDIESASEGDFVQFEDFFNLYDFDLISTSTSSDNVDFMKNQSIAEFKTKKKEFDKKIAEARKQLKKIQGQSKASFLSEIKILENELSRLEDEAIDPFNTLTLISSMAKYMNSITAGNLLIKTKKSFTICERDKFRLSSGQLSFLTESTRKINIFGTVTAIKENTHPEGNFNEFESDELGKIPSTLADVLFSNFQMIKAGDKIVRPIAIFFE